MCLRGSAMVRLAWFCAGFQSCGYSFSQGFIQGRSVLYGGYGTK